MNSDGYKKYLADNKVVAAPISTSVEVPAKNPAVVSVPVQAPVQISTTAKPAEAVLASTVLVDKAKYDELLGDSNSPRFKTATSIKIALFGRLGFAESVSADDKDKLAKSLFDKKTYEQYVALCGGKAVEVAPAKPTEVVAPSKPVASLTIDDKIFANFAKSIKISNVLLAEIIKDQSKMAA